MVDRNLASNQLRVQARFGDLLFSPSVIGREQSKRNAPSIFPQSPSSRPNASLISAKVNPCGPLPYAKREENPTDPMTRPDTPSRHSPPPPDHRWRSRSPRPSWARPRVEV
ncbi:hypothetical protein KC330_g192 [Hortaea werneckii]|nr:hypothetical protein KC330_g192 [Hortaea werneckii]